MCGMIVSSHSCYEQWIHRIRRVLASVPQGRSPEQPLWPVRSPPCIPCHLFVPHRICCRKLLKAAGRGHVECVSAPCLSLHCCSFTGPCCWVCVLPVRLRNSLREDAIQTLGTAWDGRTYLEHHACDAPVSSNLLRRAGLCTMRQNTGRST